MNPKEEAEDAAPGPRFTVGSADEGKAALDHFNGFHDGFIRRLEIVSRDRFEGIGSQTASGTYDVAIELGHYNYPDGPNPFHPVDQVVEARFREVEDIYVDLAREFLGSPVISLSIETERRRRSLSQDSEGCLALHWGRHFYLEGSREWEFRRERLFTFSTAEFIERS